MSLDVAARSTQIRNDSSVTTPRSDAAVLVVRDLGEHDDGVAWNAFVSAATNAELYHDFRWRAVIGRVFGHQCRYLAAYDAVGAVRGVLPLVLLQSRLFGKFLVSMPFLNYGGLLASDLDARRLLLEAAVREAGQTGAGHVELRHRVIDLDWPKRTDKVAMVLDLPTSEEILFKTFPSKLRAQIRRPQKAGATVGFGGAELLDDFYAVFARNMRDLGTPVYPRAWFLAIAAAFPEHAQICVVRLNGRPVAAGFLLRHGNTMEIPWASSVSEFNREGVNMLLYWSVLCAAIAQGCRRFDFGRSSKDSGIYKFKQQWGASPEQLEWHYWVRAGDQLPGLTPSNPKYRLAIAAWRKLPLRLANFLGPHIVKNLP
jgi:serine/alanine adding enzyme